MLLKEQYGSGYKFINVLDILNNEFITHGKIIGSVNVNEEIINKFPVNYGDILFQRSSETREEVGTTSVYLDKDNTATFGGFVIRGKKIGEYEPVFLNKLLKTDLVRNQIMSKSGGSTRYNVGQEILASAALPLPSLTEQTKIASFLSLIDQRIKTQNKIIEELKLLKNTLSKKMLSGQLRFKDGYGNDFPTWKLMNLGELGNFQTSSIDKLSRENEREVFLVNYMNVYRHENINKETLKSFQIVTAKDAQIESCNLKKGDILFTPSSETPNDIGHSVVIFEDLKNTVFSYHLMRFRPKTELDILYSHYFCNTPYILNQLSKLATGSTRFTISVKSFSQVETFLPCKEEQSKIANLLSKIDLKLVTEDRILQKLQFQKQYVLANLFI